MELNNLLFPAPPVQYTPEELQGDAVYIPRFYRFNQQHQSALKKLAKNKKKTGANREESKISSK
jgi:hypothetical protein